MSHAHARYFIRHRLLIQEFVGQVAEPHCGFHRLRPCRSSENTLKYFINGIVSWFPHATFNSITHAVIRLSSGESVSWTWRSFDAGRSWGLSSGKTAKLDRQCWKSELMRPLVEALQYAEEPGGSDTLQRQHSGFKQARTRRQSHTQSTRRFEPS